MCVCILIQRPNSSHNGNTSPPSKATQSKMATGWQMQGGGEVESKAEHGRLGVRALVSGLSGCCCKAAQDDVQNVLNSQFICKFILSPMLLLLLPACNNNEGLWLLA